MLTRSFVAVLCGALAVAALPGHDQYYPDEGPEGDQWVARLDKPRPGTPKFPFPPRPADDQPPPPPPPGAPPTHPPGAPPHHPKVDDKTIFQALGEDDRFSRIYKLVNYTEDITAILNDSSKSITFFAPPDRALRPPKRHTKPKDTEFDEFGVESFFSDDVIKTSDELEMFSTLEGFVDRQLLDNPSDADDDKERKKKIIKKILTAVLKYHILSEELPAKELAKNSTFATALTLGDGSLHSEPLRLRVEQPPRLLKPTLSLNFYASVIFADVKTKNGVIHVVNHPLFPPPSTFTALFAFSDVFSTLTSVIQRVNFLDDIDWHWNHESKTLEGAPAVTIFAPTNEAFHRLPKKLKLYLFSPFGQRALKKILSYHVVPDFVLYSNWAHNASDEDVAFFVDQDNAYAQIQNGFDMDDFDLGEALFDMEDSPFGDVPSPEGEWFKFDGERFEHRAAPEQDGYGFPSGEYGPPGPRHFPSPPQGMHSPPEWHGVPPPPPPPHQHGPPQCPPPQFPHPPEFGRHREEFPHPPFGFPHGPHPRGPPGCPLPEFPHPPEFGRHREEPSEFPRGPRGPPPHRHEDSPRPHSPSEFPHGPEGFPHGPEGLPRRPEEFPHGPEGFPRPPPRSPRGPEEFPHPPEHFPHGPESPRGPPPPGFPHPPPEFGCPPPHHHRGPPPPFGRPPPPPFGCPPPPPFGCPPPPPPPPPFGCPPPHHPEFSQLPPPPFLRHECRGPPPFGPFPEMGPHHKPGPKRPLPHPKPVYSANITLPTLLANHSLSVHVAQFHSVLPHKRYTTAVFVNGQWVVAPDVPARNGAIHVVKKLISPKGKKHGPPHSEEGEGLWEHEDVDLDWEDWEEWLPQWAAED